MNIALHVNVSPLLSRMRNAQRRIAYGTVNAINNTAKKIQEVERAELRRHFAVRTQFIERQVAVIKPFASVPQGRPFAIISVGQRSRLLLSTFEAGGDRPPFKGRRVAVPITGGAARPEFTDPVPEALRFRALRIHRERRGKKGRDSRLVGELGTYVVPGVGVFQRTADGSHLLYKFKDHVQLRPRLGFVETADRTAAQWFTEFMEREVVEAIARDRGRSL